MHTAYNIPYIGWMVILCDHNIIKISFGNVKFCAVQGEKVLTQVVYQSLPPPPQPPGPNTQIT